MSIKKNSLGHRCLGLEALETRLTPAVTEDFSRILANPTQFAANRMLITLSPATQPNYRMGAYGPGIQLTRSFSIVPDLYEARLTGTTVARALQSLARNNIVVTASPNMRIEIAQTPNDSQFSRLFGMNNTGQTGGRRRWRRPGNRRRNLRRFPSQNPQRPIPPSDPHRKDRVCPVQ